MQKGYTNNTIFKITFTGVMLALVLLFQFLEKFMPIFSLFMKVNLSIVFIMATIYVAGFRWAFILLLLRFAIGPAIGSTGYDVLGIWGHFMLFVMGLFYMVIFYVGHKFIFSKIKLERNRLIVNGVFSTLMITFIATGLNAVIGSPVYFWLMGAKSPSIASAKEMYAHVTFAFFGIKNYWAGMFAAYSVGNLIKYSVASVAFIGLWKIVKLYEKK